MVLKLKKCRVLHKRKECVELESLLSECKSQTLSIMVVIVLFYSPLLPPPPPPLSLSFLIPPLCLSLSSFEGGQGSFLFGYVTARFSRTAQICVNKSLTKNYPSFCPLWFYSVFVLCKAVRSFLRPSDLSCTLQ